MTRCNLKAAGCHCSHSWLVWPNLYLTECLWHRSEAEAHIHSTVDIKIKHALLNAVLNLKVS